MSYPTVNMLEQFVHSQSPCYAYHYMMAYFAARFTYYCFPHSIVFGSQEFEARRQDLYTHLASLSHLEQHKHTCPLTSLCENERRMEFYLCHLCDLGLDFFKKQDYAREVMLARGDLFMKQMVAEAVDYAKGSALLRNQYLPLQQQQQCSSSSADVTCDAEEEISAPKPRRGRPPRRAQPAVYHAARVTQKPVVRRRPGRPPKCVQTQPAFADAAVPLVRRRPGRPPKRVQVQVEVHPAPPARRRPGRPPKSVTTVQHRLLSILPESEHTNTAFVSSSASSPHPVRKSARLASAPEKRAKFFTYVDLEEATFGEDDKEDKEDEKDEDWQPRRRQQQQRKPLQPRKPQLKEVVWI